MNRIVSVASRRAEFVARLELSFLEWMAKRRSRRHWPRMAVISGDAIGNEIAVHGVYERQVLEPLFQHVLLSEQERFKECVALDVGANIGNHSIYLSNFFRRVYAFEPGFVAWNLLQANLRLNSSTNVSTFRRGLSNRSGSATLTERQSNNIGTASIDCEGSTGTGEQIELIQGDSMLSESLDRQEVIALVKIDVEGHEAQAFEGLANTLRTHKPIVLFESLGGPSRGDSVDLIVELSRYGYSNFYTLSRDLPLPCVKGLFLRALLRLFLRPKYRLRRVERSVRQFHNLVIATHAPLNSGTL